MQQIRTRTLAPRRALAGAAAILLAVALAGPAAAQSNTDQQPAPAPAPAGEQPAAEQPAGEQPAAEQPAGQQPGLGTETVSATYQDWQMICQQVSADQQICGAVQEVLNEKQNLALWIAFGYFQPGRGPVMIMRVPYDLTDPPTGFRVAQGIQLAVDGGSQVPVPFEVCAPGGCQIGVLMEDDFVKALKAGNRLNLIVPLSNGQQATINASLKGFTAAFNALEKPTQ